jgi:hypothetical protein
MAEWYPSHPIDSTRAKKSGAFGTLIKDTPLDIADGQNAKGYNRYQSPSNFDTLSWQDKWGLLDNALIGYLTHQFTQDNLGREKEKYIFRIGELLWLIDSSIWKIDTLSTFSIEKWILSLSFKKIPTTWERVFHINLASIFMEKWLNTAEIDRARQPHQSLDTLRQSLKTESFFGWAIVVSYQQKEIGKKALWWALWTLAVVGSVDTIEYWVRKILFRDESGKMQEVDPKIVKSILKGIGDKTRINSLLFKVMQSTGRVYNSMRNGFTDITTLGIDRATEKVRLLKRADIEAARMMTDADFEAEKIRVISEIARTPRSALLAKSGEFLTASTKILQWIWAKAIHYMFWWVVFQEYQKNSYDLANAYKGIAETGLFFSGAHLGSRVAPGVWKMPAWLIGGGLAILGWHTAGGAMWLDKQIWRMMPERMSGDSSKSKVGHILSWWIVNDVTDITKTDIGIPGTRGWAVLYNPFGKDGILPNIDFAGTHITFWTNPREYLQSRIGWTDIHWNKRMDEYVLWATDMTMKILQEHDTNRGYFVSSNGRKEELLRERLRHVFDSEDGKNTRNSQIVDDCIEYIVTKLTKITDLNSRKELLSIFLGNYGNVLKIDKQSIDYDEKLLERDKTILDWQKQMYLILLTPEKRAFAEKAFTRLQEWGLIVEGKFVETINSRGGNGKLWKSDSKELALYQSLIDDTATISSEWYDILGYNPRDKKDFTDKITSLDNLYKIDMSSHMAKISETQLQWGIWDTLSRVVMIELAKIDPTLRSKIQWYIQGKTLEKPSPNIWVNIAWKIYKLGDILAKYTSVYSTKYRIKDEKPTQWDVFTFLLTTQTEYREQKRYIDTQKNIWYANKWR